MGNAKILLVDDSETVIEATRLALEEGGYEVVAITQPAMFPVTLSREKPDLVLVDVSMPVLKGQELIELARRHRPPTCPILLYSAQPENTLQALVKSSGANGYIRKSDDEGALLRAVASYLGVSTGSRKPDDVAHARDLVFIVDEHQRMRLLLEQCVRIANCEPVFFQFHEQCLTELRKRRPLMVLVDLSEGSQHGLACCKAIKENETWSGITVVMMTEPDAPGDVMHCWRAGADDFVPKPVRADQIELKIASIRAALKATGSPVTRHEATIKRVLLGESNRFWNTMLGGMLEHSGYGVAYAKSAPDALAVAKELSRSIDAAVIDLGLPGIDAPTLIKRLRQEANLQGPIVAISMDSVAPEVAQEIQLATGSPVLDTRTASVETVVNQLNVALHRVAVDLRAHQRVPFFSVVEFRGSPNAPWHSGFSYDLSLKGIFIRTLTPVPRGNQVELKVIFPGSKDWIHMVGNVAWANPMAPRNVFSYPIGMGVQLNLAGPEQKARIAEVVTANVGNHLAAAKS